MQPERSGSADPAPAPLDVAVAPGTVTVGNIVTEDLQEALDAAAPGDVIAVGAGTWTGPFLAYVPVTIGGVGDVVLDGAANGPALTAAGGVALLDLTLTGGRAVEGGGLRVIGDGGAVLARCTVERNQARSGGGVWIADGTLSAPDSTFADNDARDGGGFYADHAIVEGGTWIGNRASASGGGGVLLESRAVDVAIADNEAAYGGGLYALASEVVSAVLDGNDAPHGAGVFAVSDGWLVDTTITHHPGAGLSVGAGRVEITGGRIAGNTLGAVSDAGLGQELTSIGTDWGAGDDGFDVSWGHFAYGFGARATFACDRTGCAD